MLKQKSELRARLYCLRAVMAVRAALGLSGNRPLEPMVLRVEFFPIEEVLYEEIKIHEQPDY